jgi:hypothetical protein
MLMQIRNNWAEFKDHYLRVSEVFLNTAQSTDARHCITVIRSDTPGTTST